MGLPRSSYMFGKCEVNHTNILLTLVQFGRKVRFSPSIYDDCGDTLLTFGFNLSKLSFIPDIKIS